MRSGNAASGAQHRVLKHADVARPRAAHEVVQGGRLDAPHFIRNVFGVLLEKEVDEKRHVVHALAQRRNLELGNGKTIVDVRAHAPLFDQLRRTLVHGGDDAHVAPIELGAAHALEGLVLQEAKELHLHGKRNRIEFVEEKRPSVGDLQVALTVFGSGKGALHRAEEARIDERIRERAAVERHEGLLAPFAFGVDHFGQKLLARSRLAEKHDGNVGRRKALGRLDIRPLVAYFAEFHRAAPPRSFFAKRRTAPAP